MGYNPKPAQLTKLLVRRLELSIEDSSAHQKSATHLPNGPAHIVTNVHEPAIMSYTYIKKNISSLYIKKTSSLYI